MPRLKTMSDSEILAVGHRLIHERGPRGLTFESLAKATGLSPSTLVQRFESKTLLTRRALLHAWERLEAQTAELGSKVPKTVDGAIDLLVTLTRNHSGIEAYAEGLLVLREDLRDPELRRRGSRWRDQLCCILDQCLAALPHSPPDAGMLMASHWQGALLWWGFDPKEDAAIVVEASLKRFIAAIANPA